jgi:hypothetical protein
VVVLGKGSFRLIEAKETISLMGKRWEDWKGPETIECTRAGENNFIFF